MSSVIDEVDIIHHPIVDSISGLVLDLGHSSSRSLSDLLKDKGADGTLTSLTVHDCPGLSILDGLEAFPELKVLMLIDCTSLVDLSPLISVPGLEALSITGSNVIHVDVLENHPHLRILDADGCNKLDDIWGLRNCTELTFVSIPSTSVSSISSLVNCTKIEQLDISGTLVGDITALTGKTNLIALDASNTPCCECDALTTCTSLIRLAMNSIRRIAPLCKLPELSQLYITNAHFSDPTPLKTCPELMIVSIITTDNKEIDVPFLDENENNEEDEESDDNNEKDEHDLMMEEMMLLDSGALGTINVSLPDPTHDYTAVKKSDKKVVSSDMLNIDEEDESLPPPLESIPEQNISAPMSTVGETIVYHHSESDLTDAINKMATSHTQVNLLKFQPISRIGVSF